MMSYMIVAVVSGILFAILDGVLNANPLAQRLFEVYKPIARTSINPIAGIVIDLAYGFIMAGVFLLQQLVTGDALRRGHDRLSPSLRRASQRTSARRPCPQS